MNVPFMIFAILAMVIAIGIGTVVMELIEGKAERRDL